LTPGEFVVNKRSAQKFGPLLQAMNNKKFKGTKNMKGKKGRTSPLLKNMDRRLRGKKSSLSDERLMMKRKAALKASKMRAEARSAFKASQMQERKKAALKARKIRIGRKPSIKKISQMQERRRAALNARKFRMKGRAGSMRNTVSDSRVQGGGVYNYSVTVNAGSNASADDIARATISKIQQYDKMSLRSTSNSRTRVRGNTRNG
jgi:hypothetical protein